MSQSIYRAGEIVRVRVDALRPDGVATGDRAETAPAASAEVEARPRRSLPLLIEGGLPSEVGLARILHVGKHQAIARMLDPEASSADRRPELPCPRWTPDSPCRLMHLDDGSQRSFKRERVERALSDAGLRDIAVAECQAPSAGVGSRSKVSYVVGRRRGEIVLGAFRRGSHTVQPMVDCLLPEPALQSAARAMLAALNLGACAIANPALRVVPDTSCGRPDDDWSGRAPARREGQLVEGGLRYLVMRANRNGEVAALLLTPSGQLTFAEGLASDARARFAGFAGFYVGRSGSGNALIGEGAPVAITGSRPLEEELSGLTFEVSPRSFFQVNRDAADALHRAVVELSVGERALDLYCGSGAITLRLAQSGAAALGVESDPDAIRAAQLGAERNGLDDRARFESGDAAEIIHDLSQAGRSFDTVVINPPRRGCDAAVLEGLADLMPKRVIYVSCDPKTLARDGALMAKLGLHCQGMTPYDLFPHSEHVEVLAVFEPDPQG